MKIVVVSFGDSVDISSITLGSDMTIGTVATAGEVTFIGQGTNDVPAHTHTFSATPSVSGTTSEPTAG